MSESEHESKAEESAERAGGYLQAAEQELDKAIPDPSRAGAYAQMAQASATLSLAQRVAAQDDAQ
jgi:hypothetical protein